MSAACTLHSLHNCSAQWDVPPRVNDALQANFHFVLRPVDALIILKVCLHESYAREQIFHGLHKFYAILT